MVIRLNQILILKKLKILLLESIENKIISVSSKKNKWWYSVAALIIISFAAAYFFLFSTNTNELITNENKTKIKSDSLKISNQNKKDNLLPKEKLIAESKINPEDFKPNPVLDNFINRNIRSEENGVKLLLPVLNDTVNTSFNFRWKSVQKINVERIVVVNNKNKKVWEKVTKGKEAIIDKKLNSGLYYWKVYADNKLEAVSKFYIKY